MSSTPPGRPSRPRPSSARPSGVRPRSAASSPTKTGAKGRPQQGRTRRKIAGERPQQRRSWGDRVGALLPRRAVGGRERAPRPERSAPRGRAFWTVALVAAAAVAFAIASGLHAWDGARDARALDSAQSDATAAASEAAETILSYRYTDIAADLEKARGTMTPAYARKVANIEKPLTSLAEQRKLVVQALVRNLAPMPCGDECSTDRVDVLVFADQVRTSDGKPLATEGSRSVFTMTRTDDRWLVSMVTTR